MTTDQVEYTSYNSEGQPATAVTFDLDGQIKLLKAIAEQKGPGSYTVYETGSNRVPRHFATFTFESPQWLVIVFAD